VDFNDARDVEVAVASAGPEGDWLTHIHLENGS